MSISSIGARPVYTPYTPPPRQAAAANPAVPAAAGAPTPAANPVAPAAAAASAGADKDHDGDSK
jgi:hypothetical protein